MGAQFTLGCIPEALGAVLERDPARVILGIPPPDVAGPRQVSFPFNRRSARTAARRRAQEIEDGLHA